MDIKLLNVVSWGGNPLGHVVYLALKEMNLDYGYELIESDNLFDEFGVNSTPAMIINGDIVFEGRIPPILELKYIIKNYL